MMLGLFGTTTLALALCCAILQSLPPLLGYWRNNPYLLACARPAALGQCVLVILSYTLLMIGFANDDFSIMYVAANSHPLLPMLYKLTAVWGGHEGSILLWVLILNIWTMMFCFTASRGQHNLQTPCTLAILGVISLCFLSFLLFTSNPFIMTDIWQQGRDLNPLLQDPGFVIHPPMLYMGYVGFSVAFAITQAALLCGKLDKAWAKLTRCYALAAWCFLTLGITLGSWWAYRVLGWGGFWFWDPVENASLLPWLAGVALIHVLLLVEKRTTAISWATFLASITFVLSILGTFLVRSGVLISVHTFANDPTRGIFLLLLLTLIAVAALTLYVIRIPQLTSSARANFPLFSREFALLVNSALLFLAMCIVLLGTLYPLIIDAFHLGAISVGAPYFNKVMLPLVIIIMICMGLVYFCRGKNTLGMVIAHAGFFILVLGLLLSSFLSQESEVRIKPGDMTQLGPYQFLFLGTQVANGPNYRGIRAGFEVIKKSHHITSMYPEKRIYTVREMVMTKVAIHPSIFRDLYIALGEPLEQNDWSVRLYYKPFIRWIWMGGIIMILGGIIAIRQRVRT